MSNYARRLTSSFLVTAIVAATAALQAAPVFSLYRGVTLGDSLATVMTELGAETASLKVVHELPSLIQEVTWRPQQHVSGQSVVPDPLSEMVLTFHAGRLVRIAAVYDRDRTQGLTDADLSELVSAVYGEALLPSRATATNGLVERRIIGSWGDAETVVALWADAYPRRLGLTISAQPAAARMDEAAAISAGVYAAQEPARRRALEAAAAAAIVDREALIRAQNKARFKP